MLLGLKQEELDNWKVSMHAYEKAKRTKRPFGRGQPEVQKSFKHQIKEKEMRFNPVLQSFREQRQLSRTIEHEQIAKVHDNLKFIQNNYKYAVDYDIINNHPSYVLPQKMKSMSLSHEPRKKEYRDPTYNDFDIINGKEYKSNILEKRELKRLKHYERKIRLKHKNYDIISGQYQDAADWSRVQSNVKAPQHERSTLDPTFCRYSNPEDQEQFRRSQKIIDNDNGKKAFSKMPPSYRAREALTLDPTTALSPEVEAADLKDKKAKERYRQRYQIESEYKMRNDYEKELQEELATNRVHNGRVLQAKARQFNILNAHSYHPKRSQLLFRKEADPATYDIKAYVKEISLSRQSPIKQSGFNTIC